MIRLDPSEYLSIFYLFANGSGGISLDEMQAASEGLGNQKSVDDLVA